MRLAFNILAAAWVMLLLAAPATALGVSGSALTYAFGSWICHQRPERSFHIGAAQLPVCARCLGIYIGALTGVVMAGLKHRPTALWRGPSRLRIMLVTAAVPTVMTWTAEVLGLWSPTNVTRFVAALPLGVAVAVTVNYIGCVRQPRTGLKPPQLPI